MFDRLQRYPNTTMRPLGSEFEKYLTCARHEQRCRFSNGWMILCLTASFMVAGSFVVVLVMGMTLSGPFRLVNPDGEIFPDKPCTSANS